MFPICFKHPALLCMAILTVVLSGCGLIQKVVDEPKSVASAVFHKQIKILHLDFFSRSTLNTDAEDTPLSATVHVWQLKTHEDFDKADYDTLLMQEEKTLGRDVLTKHTVWVKPEDTASLNVPLDKGTQFVAIIGQFYHPNEKSDSWHLVIKRDELEADEPRSIELVRSDLRPLPLKDKQPMSTPSLYKMLMFSLSGKLPLEQISERDRLILSVMDNMRRIINCRAGTLVHLSDYGLPDLSLVHQGMAAGIHGLVRQIEETLLRYEPCLSQIQVELLPQPRPRHPNYLIHVQLPDTGWIRFDGVFSPEGRIILRYLKQQERAY